VQLNPTDMCIAAVHCILHCPPTGVVALDQLHAPALGSSPHHQFSTPPQLRRRHGVQGCADGADQLCCMQM
jgi:hypothetical protein